MANKITLDTDALGINWQIASTYRFELEEGVVLEDGGESQPNPLTPNFYSITTNSTGPSFSASIPGGGATGVRDNSQIAIQFNRYVRTSTGNIKVYRADTDALLATISASDSSKVTANNGSIIVVLDNILIYPNTGYYFLLDADFAKDYDGFSSSAVTSHTAIAYAVGGAVAINSASPALGATYVSNNTSLVLTFDSRVHANTGNIYLYKVGTTDTLIHTFDINDSSLVTVSNYTVTINLTGYIKSLSTYYFLIDSGTVKDYGGILFLGISSHTAIRYSTTVLFGTQYTISNSGSYATGSPFIGSPWGASISMTNDYLLIGAGNQNATSTKDDWAGWVYLYNASTGSLVSETADPNAYGGYTLDNFGASVAISGTNYIVGAPGEDDSSIISTASITATSTSGDCSLTRVNGSDSSFLGTYQVVIITGTNTGTGSISGYTSGNYYWMDGSPGTGGVKLYSYPSRGAVTTTVGTLTGLIVTAQGSNNSGKIYVYNTTGGGLLRNIANPNTDSRSINDQFGSKVALYGTTSIAGSPNENYISNSGTSIDNVTISNTTGKFKTTTTNLFFFTPDGGHSQDITQYDYTYKYPIKITGTNTGTGSISGYTTGRVYWTYGIYVNNNIQYFDLWEFTDANTKLTPVTTTAGTLTGLTFVVGTPNVGRAYIHNISTGALTYTLENPTNSSTDYRNDKFGRAVAIGSSYAAVSSVGKGSGSMLDPITTTKSDFPYDFPVSIVVSTSGTKLSTVDPRILENTVINISGTNTGTGTISGYTTPATGFTRQYGIKNVSFTDGSYLFDIFDLAWGRIGGLITECNFFGKLTSNTSITVNSITSGSFAVGQYLYIPSVNNSFYVTITAVTGSVLTVTAINNYGPWTSATGVYTSIAMFATDTATAATKLALIKGDTGSLTGLNFYWPGNRSKGKVYIYSTSTGSLARTISSPDSTNYLDNKFGQAIAIYGNKILIGAPGEKYSSYTLKTTSSTYPVRGRAYLYDMTNGNLLQTFEGPELVKRTSTNSYADSLFGSSVAMNSKYLVIGAPEATGSNGKSNSGLLYVYEVSTGTLLSTVANPNQGLDSNSSTGYISNENDYFSYAVAASELAISASAPFEDPLGSSSPSSTGVTYILKEDI